MLRWCCLVGLGLVFVPSPARAAFDNFGVGDGHSNGGSQKVINGATSVNFYARLTAINDTTHIVVDDVSNLNPGDLLMLWQPAGLTPPASTDPGSLTDISSSPVGQWELARIGPNAADIDGSTGTVHLIAGITPSKFTINITQVVSVPEYSSLKFAGGGGTIISNTPWDGKRGGIIAFLVAGTLDMTNGAIKADGIGAQGGSISPTTTGNTSCNLLDYIPSNPDGAPKGQGIAAAGNNGRGAVANGGGGGDCASSGGGGGGNVNNTCTPTPCTGLGGNNVGNSIVGGVGGGPLTYDLKDHLTFGGGGGAGNNANGAATAGGNGGGVIFIRANTIAAGGLISAKGGNGGSSGNDGLGGGGAGGAIYVRTIGSADICSAGEVSVAGGNGGTSSAAGVGPGGGGSGGRVFIQSSNVCVLPATDYAGGLAGTDSAASTRGAQNGGAGFQETPPTGGYCFGFAQCGNGDQVCSFSNNDYNCVACTTSTDCTNSAKPICTGGTCVTCTLDSDCLARDPTTPACVAGQCQGCSAKSSVCSGTTPICEGDGHCGKCNGASDDCPATSPICKGDGSCNDCTGTNVIDAACQTLDPEQPICLGPGAGCGGCSSSSQCTLSATHPVCDGNSGSPTKGACIGCTAANNTYDPQCATKNGGDTPICSASACVACSPAGGASQCPSGTLPICLASGQCHVCNGSGVYDTDCVGRDPNEPVCNSGLCAKCTDSSQCTDATHPTCDLSTGHPTSGQCIGCTAGANAYDPICAAHNADTPICQASGGCAGCATSIQCPVAAPVEPICQGNGSCLACGGATANSDCQARLPGGTTPFCSTGSCVACDTDAHCNSVYPATPICSASGACGLCSQNSQCKAINVDTPICGASGCRACANTNDCEGSSLTTPFCDLPTGDCQKCTSDTMCTVGARPACQGDGSCKQCSATNSSQCTDPAAPACNTTQGKCVLCTVGVGDLGRNSVGCAANTDGHACEADSGGAVFCGCTVDSDCGSSTSGRICDGQTHKCKDGCSRAPGRNNCPTTEFCTSDDPTGVITGVCTLACNFDVDCSTTPTMPFCIDAGGDAAMGHCAACRDSNDCGPPTAICLSTSTNVCVQCTDSDTSACSKFGVGAACLASNVCGCETDGDCGSDDTGRVCDNLTHACGSGCRGTDGNGCPRGMVCTSTDTTVGTCVNPTADLAMSVPEDMSMTPIGGQPDLAAGGGPNSLEGGGLSCAIAGRDPSSDAGELVLMLLLLAGAVAWRRRARLDQ